MEIYLINFLSQVLLFSSTMLYLTKSREYHWKVNIVFVAGVIWALASTIILAAGVYGFSLLQGS